MGYIRLAVAISEETALATLGKQTVTEKVVEWNGLIPRSKEIKKAGRIILDEKQVRCSRNEVILALSPMLTEKGLSLLPWEENNKGPSRLFERIRFFVNRKNNAVNNNSAFWSDESLLKETSEWLGPFIWNGAEKGREIIDADGLYNALTNRLGFKEKQEMDKLVPEYFTMPSGRKRLIDYSSGEPVLQIRLQDAFGITGNCSVMGVPYVFHLLSPAGRPVQITRDLIGFWKGSYADVRKDMRGRYPKHHWPEKPV